MLGKKLRYLREKENMTQEELGKILNLSKANISKYESNSLEPNINTINKIANYFKVSTDYLIGLIDYPYCTDEIVNYAKKKDIPVEQVFKEMCDGDFFAKKLLPVLGTIRAGIPLFAEDNIIDYVDLPAGVQADFALNVTGDSMSWIGIHAGDTVFMKKIEVPFPGTIVAAGIEAGTWEATLKFYMEENETKVLRAANPDYEDIPVTENHRIIGEVVSIIKDTPSPKDYKNIVLSKKILDGGWDKAVEKAVSYGLSGEKLVKLIELFSHMVKQV